MSEQKYEKDLQYIKDNEKNEMLLKPSLKRFNIFPIKHGDIWKAYKQHTKTHWVAEEIDIVGDKPVWNKMQQGERQFIKMVLAFFASADGIVFENLSVNFIDEIQLPEARAFYGYQMMIEMVHAETYGLLIDTYIDDEKEKDKLFGAIETIPSIKNMADWALKWMNNENAFAVRLVAFAVMEGVFFCSPFCSIFYMKHKNILLKGLITSNDFIQRDECLHTLFGVLLYGKLENKLPQACIYVIVSEGVDHCIEFVKDSLPLDLIGMNATLMIQYVKFVADGLITKLGYKALYKVKNPFKWMETIGLESKDNFFEGVVTNYAKFNGDNGDDDFMVDGDIDF